MKQKKQLVVTISRQLGSGGAYIGTQIAKKMDMMYADREIISEAAKKFSVGEADIVSCDERILSFWQSLLKASPFTQDLYVPPRMKAPGDHELFEAEAEIIRCFARKHSAVIIGRCGFHVLRKMKNHVSLFFYAGTEFRINRIQEIYDVSPEAAATMIARSDRERSAYCKSITGKDWADARNYHLSIDTARAGIEKTVELTADYLESI
ncbi:MAG TPA: cytidylate kinase-like family protein [Spirochaetota bacterium]|nr:cytidylate kinase-like family protein [Spirochaetota bacterium]HPL19242.1 cytidylate kinase-like family protein [Spirochaetota bacterium]HQJ69858.1 cytidylate kinase-like family protein [Spirochaetota bacterium]HRS76316.1 cytidylate kinase-like family protein [Spirochaetota bacterium]HRT73961.1 cytidylate kinase-like family protein [Spirochaetota bacterium]